MVLKSIVDLMCTNGIQYYCRHYVHNTKRLWKKKKKKKKINRVNTMTTIETISWSKRIVFLRSYCSDPGDKMTKKF